MPDTEVMIRNSERSKFKGCRQAWWWSYEDRLKPHREKSALGFGTLTHRVLELRYPVGRKRGPRPDRLAKKVWMEYLKAGGEEFTVKIGNTQVPADELLVHMMTNYYDEYGDDDRYEVVAPEMTFQVDVHHPTTGKYLFTFVGTIDGVWRDTWHDTLVFAEHKTGATLEPFGAPIYLDEQQGSYWAFAPDFLIHHGIISDVNEIDHVLYNRLRKAFKDDRPKNSLGHALNKPTRDNLITFLDGEGIPYLKKMKVEELRQVVSDAGVDPDQLGEVSKSQPVPLFKREPIMRTAAERARTMRRVISEAREMALVRQGKLKVYKRPSRECGFCEFREMCEVHEGGGDWKSLRDNLYTTWDPYKDHTEEEEEEDAA